MIKLHFAWSFEHQIHSQNNRKMEELKLSWRLGHFHKSLSINRKVVFQPTDNSNQWQIAASLDFQTVVTNRSLFAHTHTHFLRTDKIPLKSTLLWHCTLYAFPECQLWNYSPILFEKLLLLRFIFWMCKSFGSHTKQVIASWWKWIERWRQNVGLLVF